MTADLIRTAGLDQLPAMNSSHFSELDPDVHVPVQSNFKYYTTHDFQDSNEIVHCTSSNHFSVLHSNIRSLSANFDNFTQMLSELKHTFSVIGLTETKFKVSKEPLNNHSIPGYTFVSQPSLSNAGGTGFFISDKLSYTIRNDLSGSLISHETLWIEIQSDLHHNLICRVIYRHPNSDLEAFMTFLNHTIDKINKENKYCVIMGDFNINLLNVDSHPATDEFLNTLGSYFFNPHILQPTRHGCSLHAIRFQARARPNPVAMKN